ncbi:MAG: hypothetical protein ACFFBD_24880 [Candidatus Hodarchaeota archaeon]
MGTIRSNQFVLIKWDWDGNLFWNKSFTCIHDCAWSDFWRMKLVVDNNGGIYILGADILVKCNTEGNQLWNYTWPREGYLSMGNLAIDQEGNIFMVPLRWNWINLEHQLILMKLDGEKGTPIWNYTSEYQIYEPQIQLDSRGFVYTLGWQPGLDPNITRIFGVGMRI